ncbi:TTC21B, partial [Symbiodinium sp. CCMP2456]
AASGLAEKATAGDEHVAIAGEDLSMGEEAEKRRGEPTSESWCCPCLAPSSERIDRRSSEPAFLALEQTLQERRKEHEFLKFDEVLTLGMNVPVKATRAQIDLATRRYYNGGEQLGGGYSQLGRCQGESWLVESFFTLELPLRTCLVSSLLEPRTSFGVCDICFGQKHHWVGVSTR